MRTTRTLSMGVVTLAAATSLAADDFGLKVERLLAAQAQSLFGVEKPLQASSADSVSQELSLIHI